METAMIRISEACVSPEEVTLKLEGRLGDSSAADLEGTCERLIGEAKRVVLDVASVSYVDRAALRSLRRLRRRGVTFANGNPFVTEQLKEVERP
jgi:anti-anti-sigma regulatory factor